MPAFVAALPSFALRVFAHEATRRALSTAAAGLLVGAISEAVWPRSRS